MKSLHSIVEKMRRKPSDVVGIDLTPQATYAVRMKKSVPDPTVVATAVLPAAPFPEQKDGDGESQGSLALPSAVRARYACLSLVGDQAAIKLITLPGTLDPGDEERIINSLGVNNAAEYRIGYKVLARGHGKTESRTLAVALPEKEARTALSLFETGLPVPYTVEVSHLATMTAFLSTTGKTHDKEAIGLLLLGHDMSAFALFNNSVLVLFRRFGIGLSAFVANVTQARGVDNETAMHIIEDGSFDISQAVEEILSPLERQLILSRDFVERRDNCHVEEIHVAGELMRSPDVLQELSESIGMKLIPWNPTENLQIADGDWPEELVGQEWRWGAAIGTCLGAFEEV